MGCTTSVLRKDMLKHMEENTHKHIILMSVLGSKMGDGSLESSRKLQERRAEMLQMQLCHQGEEFQQRLEGLEMKLEMKSEDMEQQLKVRDQELADVGERLDEKDDQLAEVKGQLQEKVKQLSKIEDKVKEKEGRLSVFEKKLGEKEKQLTSVEQCLKEKDKEQAEVKRSLQEKEQHIQELRNSLQRKEERLSVVEKKLGEKDKEQSEVKRSFQEKDQQIKELRNSLQRKEEQADIKRKLQEQRDGMQRQLQTSEKDLKQRIAQLEKQLQEKDRNLEKELGTLIMSIKNDLDARFRPAPPFDFVMPNFTKLKASSTEWYSPPFYSHPGGYRLSLRVEANGYGSYKRQSVSCCFYTEPGEYDELLKWPRKSPNCYIQLLNHRTRKWENEKVIANGAFNKPATAHLCCDNWRCYIIAHSYLTPYLQDDCLHFRVSKIVFTD